MEDTQTRALNAAVSGQSFMDDPANSPIWTGKPAVVTKKDQLDASITRIGEIDDGIVDPSGIAESKSTAKEKGAKSSWRIAKALAAYYRDQNDLVNLAEVDFELTDLRNVKDQDAADRWQLVQDKALPLAATLDAGGYGVDAAMVTQQLTDLNDFKGWWGKPKAAIADTKAKNQAMDLEFRKLKEIIVELKERLVQFEELRPIFYNGAVAAFEEDESGVRHQAIVVEYVDDVSNIRLPGVKTKLVELALEKVSSDAGVVPFMQAEAPQGNYTLESVKAGYRLKTTANVISEVGKLTRLEIRMEKV